MEEEGGSESLLQKYKVYIITGFIVLFIVSFIIGFFVLRGEGGRAGDDFFRIVNKKDVNLCDNFIGQKIIDCKIAIFVKKDNKLLCENFGEGLLYELNLAGENIVFSARDMCLIRMADINGKNYCENILDIRAKEICLAEVRE